MTRWSFLLAVPAFMATANAQTFEQEPGTKIKIDLSAMPEPYKPASPANPPLSVSRPADAMPKAMAGFQVNVFADKLADARNMITAPNGDVFLTASGAGKVLVLRDGNGDGKAEKVETFAEGFAGPFGLALGKDFLLVGDTRAVWRLPYKSGDMKSSAAAQQVTAEGALSDPGGHSTRAVTLHPDGSKFYVSIGSRGNINEEPEPRATIQEFKLDGSGQRTFATGLRNAVGTAFYPGTTDIYTVVNERDGLGDELVPDYLTKVQDGGFYGWPYSYMGKNPQPRFADKRPDLVAKAIVPDTPFRSHSAPVGLTFSTGEMFPKEFQGGAFVALRGSWNAAQPRGYHVAYVPWVNGKASDSYTVFLSGFWSKGEKKAEVWGRPSGVTIAKDGSLLVADDVGDVVWRVSTKK
jgi:glucose/arabinose dehydrogenase